MGLRFCSGRATIAKNHVPNDSCGGPNIQGLLVAEHFLGSLCAEMCWRHNAVAQLPSGSSPTHNLQCVRGQQETPSATTRQVDRLTEEITYARDGV